MNRGGKRPNSGRKPGSGRYGCKTVPVRVPAHLRAYIEDICEIIVGAKDWALITEDDVAHLTDEEFEHVFKERRSHG